MWSSCAEKLGARFTAGVKKELPKSYLDSTAKALSGTVARSVMATVLDDSIQSRIRAQVDSLGRQLDHQALATTVRVRDSLLSAYTQLWLEKIIQNTTNDLNTKGLSFLDNIRGDQTKQFVAALRDELLNDISLQRAAIFRDELLGNNTQALLDSLVQKIATGVIRNQVNPNIARINRQAQERIRDIKRLAFGAGGLALLIGIVALLLFRQARRHRETLKVITHQIDKIPDQVTYDKLVRSIRTEAETKGLEPHLQQILKEEKLYQQPQWQEKDYQTLHLITNYLKNLNQEESGREILQGLKEESKKVNLDGHLNSLIKQADNVVEKV
ncbi:hypothetical protein AAE02nite_50220 [Adhaeribacter aerolatus]|uniref:Uncharacterized protein n=1 Tax=Adhaeribacter aerolatus TaxID=670289 RepID=A0A512B5X4_9BACT|nr:hypothetical protein AAE02nite_50220 [Adhaeribacter aerolatus]